LAGMAAIGIWFWSPSRTFTQTVGYTWVAFFYVSLLFVALTDSGGPIGRVARIGWLQDWGRISYCVYLTHSAVRYFCLSLLMQNTIHLISWPSGVAGLLAMAISYGIAKLSWTFFEQPLLQRGHRYKY
jgi:peptidoglycan/LPS O-acetylase OafA/YrhL